MKLKEKKYNKPAVIPAWLNPMKLPNLLMLKNPCPPHRSLQVAATRSRFQVTKGFITQHNLTTSGTSFSVCK
jgi:hypothetical protein